MEPTPPKGQRPGHRMPKDSLFYERIVPTLLVAMAVLLLALIMLAAGVLLGFISF
jgi:hypothetical protein